MAHKMFLPDVSWGFQWCLTRGDTVQEEYGKLKMSIFAWESLEEDKQKAT